MLLGCGPTPELDRIRLRLGAEDFGFDTPNTRGPSAVIADELRPVVAGVESIPIFEAREVAAGTNPLEIAVVFPESAAELPVSSFILSAITLDEANVGKIERWRELVGTNWVRLEDGWTLSRDDSSGAVLRLVANALEGRALLRLSAVRPPPRVLPPEPRLPRGSGKLLGAGLRTPGHGVCGAG